MGADYIGVRADGPFKDEFLRESRDLRSDAKLGRHELCGVTQMTSMAMDQKTR